MDNTVTDKSGVRWTQNRWGEWVSQMHRGGYSTAQIAQRLTPREAVKAGAFEICRDCGYLLSDDRHRNCNPYGESPDAWQAEEAGA
jgi:hypothetical protein